MTKNLIASPIPVLVKQREFFATEQTRLITFRLEQLSKLKQVIRHFPEL